MDAAQGESRGITLKTEKPIPDRQRAAQYLATPTAGQANLLTKSKFRIGSGDWANGCQSASSIREVPTET